MRRFRSGLYVMEQGSGCQSGKVLILAGLVVLPLLVPFSHGVVFKGRRRFDGLSPDFESRSNR